MELKCKFLLKIKCLQLFLGGNWWNVLIVLETTEDQTIPEKIKLCGLKMCCVTLFSCSNSHNFPAWKLWDDKSVKWSLKNANQQAEFRYVFTSQCKAGGGGDKAYRPYKLGIWTTPFAVHYEEIRIHLRETATNSAKIHSLARKSEHLRINQIQ